MLSMARAGQYAKEKKNIKIKTLRPGPSQSDWPHNLHGNGRSLRDTRRVLIGRNMLKRSLIGQFCARPRCKKWSPSLTSNVRPASAKYTLPGSVLHYINRSVRTAVKQKCYESIAIGAHYRFVTDPIESIRFCCADIQSFGIWSVCQTDMAHRGSKLLVLLLCLSYSLIAIAA